MFKEILHKVFNYRVYSDLVEVTFNNLEDAIEHFLNFNPSLKGEFITLFDSEFYLEKYEDVGDSGIDPFHHFVKYGAEEGRLYSSANLVELKNKFVSLRYLNESKQVVFCGESSLEELFVKHNDFSPVGDRVYSLSFLKKYFPLTLKRCQKSFEIFEHIDESNYFVFKENELDIEVKNILDSGEFDFDYYTSNLPRFLCEGWSESDAITHYLCEGYRILLNPSAAFSTEYYLRVNADIYSYKKNPFLHYIYSGKKEKRAIYSSFDFLQGSISLKKDKDTVVVASHECSRTGAPIVGLELCKELSKAFNVIAFVGRDGALAQEFKANCSIFITQELRIDTHRDMVEELVKRHNIKFAILNSAETFPLLYELSNQGVKTVSLIHEFSEYARPPGRIATMALLSDVVIAPAEIIKTSIEKDCGYIGVEPNLLNIHVRHQGANVKCGEINSVGLKDIRDFILNKKLTMKKSKVVLGCGWTQPRKGVYKFFEIAKEHKKSRSDTLFVWVGGNYDPWGDPSYSAYINDYINRAGLLDSVLFIDHVEDLESLWLEADALIMSSLLDPFPNVAIDSIVRNVPVVCFENATGICELKSKFGNSVWVAKYMDAADAATQLNSAFDAVLNVDEKIIKEEFSYASYCDFIKNSADSTNIEPCSNKLGSVIPDWYLKKNNINILFHKKEKEGLLSRLISKLDLSVSFEGDCVEILNVKEEMKSSTLVLEYNGEASSVYGVFEVIQYFREIFSVGKVILLVDKYTPTYNNLKTYQRNVHYEIVSLDENWFHQVCLHTDDWKPSIFYYSLDESFFNISKVDLLGLVQKAVICKGKYFLGAKFTQGLLRKNGLGHFTPHMMYLSSSDIASNLKEKC